MLIGPTAHLQRCSSASLPVGLLGMLALVAVVEASVAGHRADLAPPWAEDWRFSTSAAERKAAGSEVLCFGDSLVKYGVLPRVIEAKTGWKSFNLATSGGTMPSAYFLLKRAFDAGAKPKAVVVDFDALMLEDAEPVSLRNYPELATMADCVDLAWSEGDTRFMGALVLAKLVPSYRWRFEVRALVRAAIEGRDGSRRQTNATFRLTWETHGGAQPMPPGRVRHPSEDYLIDGVSPASWSIGSKDEAYLDRFVALAESRGVAVYWLIPPLCPEAHARRQVQGADEAYGRLARSKLSRFANLTILDARSSRYDDSVHVDHIHLDRVGATALSGDLAAILANRFAEKAPSRWVALPNYSGRPATTNQSEVANREGTTVR